MRAKVRNGRLTLDEPTDLPDATGVELAPVEVDDLDDEDRARLHEALAASDEDFASRNYRDASEVLDDLRRRRT